jgi:hypothetical protein
MRHDQRAEAEMQQPGVEDADITFAAPVGEQLRPRARLHDVRNADDEAAERYKSLDRDFHPRLVAWLREATP